MQVFFSPFQTNDDFYQLFMPIFEKWLEEDSFLCKVEVPSVCISTYVTILESERERERGKGITRMVCFHFTFKTTCIHF